MSRSTRRVLGVGLAMGVVGAVLSSCGTSGTESQSATSSSLKLSIQPNARAGQIPAPPSLGPRSLDPSKSNGVQLDVLSGLQNDRPIFDGDFADPFALRTSDAIYLYATNTTTTKYAPGAHIPAIVLTRDSGFEGKYLGDALPTLPTWTVSGYQWAPSVWARPDGTYVMYYSTPATNPLGCLVNPPAADCVHTPAGPRTAFCISRATSSSPAGPFVDDSSSAFVCPVSSGGAIDPSVFVDANGTPWLLWKSDGDCCGLPTTIYSQQLSPDGLSVVGPPHRLIGASQAWEGGLVAGPSMIQQGDDYWLFYSANLWGSDNYGIGIAHCASVTGSCTKPLDHAWLSSSSSGGSSGGQSDPGPGGQEFFQVGGLIWMVHHGLAPGQTGNFAQRRLYVDLLAFPTGQLPRVAPRPAAAALAEAILYYGDPDLPSQPTQAYLSLVRGVGDAFSGASDASVVGDGRLACTDLGHRQPTAQVVQSLEQRHLTLFEAYVVAIFATEYFCPQNASQALADLQRALNQGP
jgi:hypothetical protein